MIVASQFGWNAVSAEPMTFYDLLLAAQLMSEERVGKPRRAASRHVSDEEQKALGKLARFKG